MAFFFSQAQRLALEREKREVQAMTVALSALFKGSILGDYMRGMDAAIKDAAPRAETRQEQVDRSIRELNKLRAVLD